MAGKIFGGALIVVGMRWADRLMGFISTLVLARLLMPDDFGIVAMASIVVGLVDVLLDLGVGAALIHKGECDDEDFSNAWSIRLIQCSLVAALIVLAAPLAASYYGDPRVAPVLRLMALGILVAGFENVGVIHFQKDMRFGSDFLYFFCRRLAGFVATLFLAWHLKSYWALPLGAFIGRAAGVGFSYAMHPFRPRFTLTRFKSLWSFSQWMLIRNIGVYADARLDRLLLGSRINASAMGIYSLADEIAALPSTELLAPIGRVLFPAFVRVRDRPDELRRTYLLALAAQAMIAIPAAAGLALLAPEAVAVLLGERWSAAAPFVQVLALVYGCNALSHAASYLLFTLGRVRIIAFYIWTQMSVFATGVIIFLPGAEALAFARWRLAVAVGGTLFFLALVLRQIPGLRPGDLLGAVWRPLLAAGAMVFLLPWLPQPSWPPLPALILHCTAGAALYAASLLALWFLAGRPHGSETYLLGKLGWIPPQRRAVT